MIKIAVTFILSLLMVPTCWSATDNTTLLYITGNLTSTSCQITTPNLDFSLHTDAVDLQAPGSASEWQDLPGGNIRLTNCFIGSTGVDVVVSGTTDTDDTNGFINQVMTNNATNVSTQLKSGDKILHNLDYFEATVNKETNTIEIPLSARLYSKNGNGTAGIVYSAVELAFVYK